MSKRLTGKDASEQMKEHLKPQPLKSQTKRARQIDEQMQDKTGQGTVALNELQELVIHSELRFRALIDALPQAIFMKAPDLTYVACNMAHAHFLGLDSPKQLIGRREGEFVSSKLARKYEADDRRVLKRNETIDAERTTIIHGREVTVHSVKTPVRDEHGKITGVLGIYWDISKRKKAEEAQALFHSLVDNSNDGIEVVEPGTLRFLDVNDTECRQLGYSREELLDMSVYDIDIMSAEQGKAIEELIRESGSARFESMHRRKDGSAFPVEVSVKLIELDKPYLLSIARDISERKRAEQDLANSEKRYRHLVESSPAIIYEYSLKNGGIYYSPQVSEILGYTLDQFYADPFLWNRSIHPDDAVSIAKSLESIRSGDDFDLEYRIKDARGNWQWLNDRSIGVREEAGEIIVTGLAVDITERKMHEMLLQARLRLNDMAPKLDYRQLMQATLDLAEELIGSNIGFFHFVEQDQETISLQAWSTHTLEEMCTVEGTGMHYPVNQAGVWADAIRRRQPVIHDDYAALPDKQGMPEGHAVVSRLATVPIMRNDKVVAIIGIGNKPQPYNDQDIGMLSQLANLTWDIIEVKKTETALAHANRALTTLGTVNRELIHATDEVKLMQSICKAIVEQRGYRMAWVGYARDNADKDVELMASAGVPEDVLEEIRPGWGDDARAVGPTGRAIRTGETQLSRDIASEPHHDWKDAMLKAGCASDIALPLKDEAGTVFGLLHVYADEVNAFAADEIRLLEEMAGDLAFGVNALRVRLERDDALKLNEQHLARMRQNLDETIVAITKAVEARDPYTAGHQRRVAKLAVAIARRMGLDEDTLQGIHMGAMIHDIGKINIPAEILSKPIRLNEMEYLMVKMHSKIGYDILKDVHFPWPVAEVAYQHHEHIDGSGYPQGLKGEQICLEARIVAVADVVEAMTSHRPYRPGLGHEAAIAEIIDHSGVFYDADAVDACLAVFADGFRFDD